MKTNGLVISSLALLVGCGGNPIRVETEPGVDLSSPLAVVGEYQRTVNDKDCDGYLALLRPDFEFDPQDEGGDALDQLAGFCTELALYRGDVLIELEVLALTEGDGDRVEIMTNAVLQFLVTPDSGWLSTTRLGFVLVMTSDGTYPIRSVTAYPRIRRSSWWPHSTPPPSKLGRGAGGWYRLSIRKSTANDESPIHGCLCSHQSSRPSAYP